MPCSTARRLMVATCLSALAGVGLAQPAADWPTRPVRIIVPYAAGGPADITAREIAQKLAALTGQPFVVENQGGGMGIPSLTAVARADPDGHTWWMPALGNVVLQPLLSRNGGGDQVARLKPLGMVTTSAHVLVVSTRLPVRTTQELVDYARAHPGQLGFASAGVGGTAHLGAELFKRLSGAEVVHVPYKGSAAAIGDLASGRVGAMFSSLPSLQAAVDKGYVRVLAATAPSTSPATRSLPLMSATLPGFEYTSWYAMYLPQQTPDAIVARASAVLQRALKAPELAEKIALHGMEPMPAGPQQVSTWVRRDHEKWGALIRETGISLD
ncbi:Argininosuccinate lyase [Delftia tsuruhatensis]|uniref:Bug family tripartite tricarboxylate transporter substrate binding protein n=1 Tax=Delftia tsuruhatensis TaxID=180282 RepID=UPI001E7C5C9C|nr:tripartite tricarboxylate transporter substrate binding protein [Delftia tsuruhatensis]CAB5681512.1 Argininosuccinate lyase [Delftia tsuruhatensis]CAC9675686.1 Argininosuccinate lyase [Delftia tsuruhatensis]